MQEEWQLAFFCLPQRFAQGVTHSGCSTSYARAPEVDPELSMIGFAILRVLWRSRGPAEQEKRTLWRMVLTGPVAMLVCKLCLRAVPTPSKGEGPQGDLLQPSLGEVHFQDCPLCGSS